MTEEIIIDGVNVVGCEHYCEKLNTGSGIIQKVSKQGFCLHNLTGLQNADIYFRALSFPKCREQSNCYYKQLKRLEQENEELKKQLSSTKCHLCGEGFLTPEGAELYEEKNNYRSALEEIRILATKNVSIENFVKIQNKINEVLK